MTEPEGQRVCIICGRHLDYREGEGWIHSLASIDPEEHDHDPLPVLPEEAGEQARARCDFCYTDYPGWVIPARSFVANEASNSSGDWAACDECKALVESDRWNRLVERAMVSYAERHPEHPLDPAPFKRLYRQLRKNITGLPRPVGGSRSAE